jgi:hypothetical protein
VLCEFAHRFPIHLADLFERDRHLTRNFREETGTDLLMMGLVPLAPFGIHVDFPDEVVTGADMDWIYAAPQEIGGGTYLRLLIQAKRAKEQRLKDGSNYWYYDHLDHGDPKGSQAQTLVTHAATSPDGMATLPLYIFYHPTSALQPAAGWRPAVEGVNLVFAQDVEPVVAGGCGREHKRVGYWRNRFMSLPDLLCWPLIDTFLSPAAPAPDATEFLRIDGLGAAYYPRVAFHPDLVAQRLNAARAESATERGAEEALPLARPGHGIPDSIKRAIEGKTTKEDRKRLKRPRVVLSTPLTREDPRFENAREHLPRRRLGQT